MLEAVFKTPKWSPRPDSNRGPFPYQGNALPPELRGRGCSFLILSGCGSYTCRQVMPPTIDEVLEQARRRLRRVDAKQAAADQAQGALLVDTRTETQRAKQGEIPGAIPIDRTMLEWRLDSTSPSRIEQATDHQIRVIVVCAEGYSSSLAAASLQDIGLVNATDVIGGFEAWKAAGLPVKAGQDSGAGLNS